MGVLIAGEEEECQTGAKHFERGPLNDQHGVVELDGGFNGDHDVMAERNQKERRERGVSRMEGLLSLVFNGSTGKGVYIK